MSSFRAVPWLFVLTAVLSVALATSSRGPVSFAQAAGTAGVVATYRPVAGGQTDVVSAPSIALYVAADQPATPFLPAGPFVAEFDGLLTVDLRDAYQFRVETNGAVRVTIGGAQVMNVAAGADAPAPSAPVRLNRGANPIKVTFTSPAKGEAFLRLYWSSAEVPWEPIPSAALSHAATERPALDRAQQQRTGRALIAEYRCTRCHVSGTEAGMPELGMDAPSFADIGARRNEAWLARWIADPRALRPDARMPQLLHGAAAAGEAANIAAFLASRGQKRAAAANPSEDIVAAGEELFAAFHCTACHVAPGESAAEGAKVPLAGVREKFAPGALAAFLLKPNQHYAWIRMPDFKLNEDEAGALAAWLEGQSSGTDGSAAGDGARGETLVTTRGCLNCHASDLSNKYAGAVPLGKLAPAAWAGTWHEGGTATVTYALTAAERTAIRAFAATDQRALERHAPAEFAATELSRLNCAGCHNTIPRIPRLDVVGGKLKPEWSRALLDGSLAYKPRPWMDARMPSFPAYAAGLSAGLAAQQGYGPVTLPEAQPVNQEQADAGRQMVASGGCANCHNVGDFVGGQVPTTAGINFAYTSDRLMYSFFHRWLMNPGRVWPETVMPRYFTGGRGPFPFYDGQADRQIRALWEYMRLGANMPPPQ